jgi:DNA-binding FadR family transcriptional regulator
VVLQVTRRIVGGELAPGSPLPVEPVFAEQFGVSRTVVREAVRVLVSKGLVEVKQGSGMRVRSPDDWDYLDPLILFQQVASGRGEALLDELLETRRVLEVEVAGMAAERRTEEELGGLETCLDGMARALEDPAEFTRLDVEFHDRILRAARNRPLREALRPIGEMIKEGRAITNRFSTDPGESQRGHERIYEAIRQGDESKARVAMRGHVRQFERDIHAALLAAGGADDVR